MKKSSLSSTLLGLLLAAGGAYAHDAHDHDTAMAAHGGQMRAAGDYHYELVVAKDSNEAKDNPVVVYVTDHAGRKISTAGSTGTATILAGKTKATASLAPDGDNRMKGSARYASTPGMKSVVSIALPGKPAEQARFTPLAVGQDGHMDHTH